VAQLPRTATGKVDRQALPEPEWGRVDETGYLAPRTVREELLAGIWAEVLGLERVGVEENFFELGGDSILSIQMVARAHRAGLRLTPWDVVRASDGGASVGDRAGGGVQRRGGAQAGGRGCPR